MGTEAAIAYLVPLLSFHLLETRELKIIIV